MCGMGVKSFYNGKQSSIMFRIWACNAKWSHSGYAAEYMFEGRAEDSDQAMCFQGLCCGRWSRRPTRPLPVGKCPSKARGTGTRP